MAGTDGRSDARARMRRRCPSCHRNWWKQPSRLRSPAPTRGRSSVSSGFNRTPGAPLPMEAIRPPAHRRHRSPTASSGSSDPCCFATGTKQKTRPRSRRRRTTPSRQRKDEFMTQLPLSSPFALASVAPPVSSIAVVHRIHLRLNFVRRPGPTPRRPHRSMLEKPNLTHEVRPSTPGAGRAAAGRRGEAELVQRCVAPVQKVACRKAEGHAAWQPVAAG